MNQTTKRTLRVVLPFKSTGHGTLLGGIRITTPAPYAGTDYYMVSMTANEAVFMKEDKKQTTHTVDRDMGCCDCAGYGHRRKCRHLDAIAALQTNGKLN